MNGAPAARGWSATPSRLRKARASVSKMCVDRVSRGKSPAPPAQPSPPAGKQRRQRRAGAARTDDHHIKAVSQLRLLPDSNMLRASDPGQFARAYAGKREDSDNLARVESDMTP